MVFFLHVMAFISEVLQLGWPSYFVSNALQSLPRRHQSDVVRMLRFFGRQMRKRTFQSMVDLPQLRMVAQADQLQNRLCNCMAGELKDGQTEHFLFTKCLFKMVQLQRVDSSRVYDLIRAFFRWVK